MLGIRVRPFSNGKLEVTIGDTRKLLSKSRAPLAVLGELPPRAADVGHALEKGEALFHEGLGHGFAVVFDEVGLVVIEIQMGRCARHEHIDNPLGPGCHVGELRLDGRLAVDAEEGGQCGHAHPGGGAVEKLTPGDGFAMGLD